MKNLFTNHFQDDQPFVIHSENYVSGLCYFEELDGNLLVVFELGEDFKERKTFYNIDKIEKIVGIYKGDVEFVKVNDREPSENYIF